MSSPTLGTALTKISTDWDAGNNQVFGTFVSGASSGFLIAVANATATYAQGAVPFTSVNIVTSTGLTFSRRGSTHWDNGSDNQYVEVWGAPFSSSLNQRVNVNFTSGNWNNGVFTFLEINGLFANSFPYDPNGALPGLHSGVSPNSKPITTTNPDDLLLAVQCGCDLVTPSIDQVAVWSGPVHHIDTAGAGYAVLDYYTKSVSAIQTALPVSIQIRGVLYVDAFTNDAGGTFYGGCGPAIPLPT